MKGLNGHPNLTESEPGQPQQEPARQSDVHQTERPPEGREGVVSDPDQYPVLPAPAEED